MDRIPSGNPNGTRTIASTFDPTKPQPKKPESAPPQDIRDTFLKSPAPDNGIYSPKMFKPKFDLRGPEKQKFSSPKGQLFQNFQEGLGDYKLGVRPMEFKVSTGFTKGGGRKNEFEARLLDVRASKTKDIGGGWKATHGFGTAFVAKGNIDGSKGSLSVQSGAFGEVKGNLGEKVGAKFGIEVGASQGLIGNRDTKVGVKTRQQLKFETNPLGQGSRFFVDQKQTISRNITQSSYSAKNEFLAGVEKDFGRVTTQVAYKNTADLTGGSVGHAVQFGLKIRM